MGRVCDSPFWHFASHYLFYFTHSGELPALLLRDEVRALGGVCTAHAEINRAAFLDLLHHGEREVAVLRGNESLRNEEVHSLGHRFHVSATSGFFHISADGAGVGERLAVGRRERDILCVVGKRVKGLLDGGISVFKLLYAAVAEELGGNLPADFRYRRRTIGSRFGGRSETEVSAPFKRVVAARYLPACEALLQGDCRVGSKSAVFSGLRDIFLHIFVLRETPASPPKIFLFPVLGPFF